MTKKQLILTIDEDVVDKAKKQIPNISGFVETCLKQYLGIGNGLVPTNKMSELVDTISKSQLELYLMNERENIEETKERAENFERDKAWRFLWNDYRIRLIPDERLLAEAVEVLKIDEETLEDILDEVFEAKDNVDTDEWATVKEWYDKVIQ